MNDKDLKVLGLNGIETTFHHIDSAGPSVDSAWLNVTSQGEIVGQVNMSSIAYWLLKPVPPPPTKEPKLSVWEGWLFSQRSQ